MKLRTKPLCHTIVCVLPILCHTFGHILQLPSQNQTRLYAPVLDLNTSLPNNLYLPSLSQNIARELGSIAQRPQIRFHQATLNNVVLRHVGGLVWSSNIADFQVIILFLNTGGPTPASQQDRFFWVKNDPPQHWNRYGSPHEIPRNVWLEQFI